MLRVQHEAVDFTLVLGVDLLRVIIEEFFVLASEALLDACRDFVDSRAH